MTDTVTYRLVDAVATITIDDGKANVLSLATLTALGAALDRAEADGAVVVLTGREGLFSGGFDLGTLRAGGDGAVAMLVAGFETAERLLAFPTPVVAAVTGHAVAMGLFLTMACDHRIGAAGPFRLVANEVAIGMTLPRAAVEILRQRLTPAALVRVATLAEPFSPDTAVAAGLLDRVVPAGELAEAAATTASALATLDMAAHAGTKRLVRAESLAALRAAIEADFAASMR